MRLLFSIALLLLPATGRAQLPHNPALPNGYSKKAMVSEQVGSTQVTITYHRPAVRGREGKVWGGLVHTGFADPGFGNGIPAPWRAGANEATIFEIDQDVTVGGQPLQKGRYALFIAYDPGESTVIFSRHWNTWGSFFYDPKDDALRVRVEPQHTRLPIEYLTYEFVGQTVNSAFVRLSWENLAISFRIEVDHLRQQFDALSSALQNPVCFNAQALTSAAGWALQNNYGLEQALIWATLASGENFPGDPSSFSARSTKAGLLTAMGRKGEAAAVMKDALPFGSAMQVQQYGRQLLEEKRPAEALEVFEWNFRKAGVQFVTLMGLTRGHSAKGNYVKALRYAEQALPLAPDEAAKQGLLPMISRLKEGKDAN